MKHLLTSIILIINFQLWVAGQELLTLDAAIQTGLQNNYNILIARNNNTIAQNNNNKGNAGFLPRLNANGGYTYTNNDSQLEFFSGDEQKRSGASNNSFRAGAALTWTAFDGFAMYATRDRLMLTEQRSQSLIEKEIHDLVTQIQNAYLILVRLHQQMVIFEESIILDLAIKKLAEDKLQLGSATELEVLQTTNQLNADSSAYLNIKDQIVQAQITLNRLMNTDLNSRYSVSSTWSPVILPESSEMISLALEQNHEIQLLGYDEKIALAQIREARAALYPSLDVNLGYNYSFSKAEAGFLLSAQTYGPTFGITLNYDIFQGKNLKKEIHSAELYNHNIQLTKKNIEADIKSQISLLYQEYLALLDLQELEKRNVITSEKNANLAGELYRLGRATDFEVREAILNLQRVRDRLSDVQYRQKSAEIQLKSLAGIPLYEPQ